MRGEEEENERGRQKVRGHKVMVIFGGCRGNGIWKTITGFFGGHKG